jgi:methionine-rich copper-binding protein CopC
MRNIQPTLLAFVIVLVACAGGSGVTPQNNTGNTSTQTAPAITSSAPTNGAVGVAVDSNLTLRFSKVMNPASVQVTTNPEADLGQSTWSDGDATMTLTPPASLEPGTTYTVALEGQDATGTALTGSKTFSFTTASAADPAPATPANLSVKPGDASVTLSWDANKETDLKGYTVFWGESPSALADSSFVDKTQTTKTITGLTNGKAYFFAVNAVDIAGNTSAQTSSLNATPLAAPAPGDTTPPATPSNLAASVSDGEVNLTWAANLEPDLKGYNVYSGTTAGSLSLAGFVGKASSSKKFTGLTNGQTYYFAVDAEDTTGNKSSRSASVNATPKDTVAPKLVSSTPKNGAQDVPLTTAFVLKFNESMQTNSLTINGVCTDGISCRSTLRVAWSDNDKTATLSGIFPLTPNKTYTMNLAAKDKAGNDMAPTAVVFTTVSAANVTVVKLLSSTPANNSIDVSTALNEINFVFNTPLDRVSFKVLCAGILAGNAQCHAQLKALLGTPTWSDADRKVSFKPTAVLLPESTWNMMPVGKDLTGKALEPTAVKFSTGSLPTVTGFLPENAARGMISDTYIAITFSKPMNESSLKTALTGTVNAVNSQKPLVISSIETYVPAGGGYRYIFHPQAPFDYNTVVQWEIGTNATDLSGNHLAQVMGGTFSILRQFTIAIPADPKLTGEIKHDCGPISGCENTAELRLSSWVGYFYFGFGLSINYRAYVSFDLLAGVQPTATTITKAILNIKRREAHGNPFAPGHLGSLSIERMDYGPSLEGSDYGLPILCNQPSCYIESNGFPDPDGPQDVLTFVQADWAERNAHGNRSQFRMRFANSQTDKSDDDKLVYQFSTLTITYLAP